MKTKPDLRVDPDRVEFEDLTGIYVGALDQHGRLGAHDIATLCDDSLGRCLAARPTTALHLLATMRQHSEVIIAAARKKMPPSD